MKMGILPRRMWLLFRGSFEKQLPLLEVRVPDGLMKQAKAKYWEIIESIPPFRENDPLEMNIISASMLAAVYLSLPEKPQAEAVKRYYAAAMGNRVMGLFLKRSNYYTSKYQQKLAGSAERSHRSTNPYSWRFTFTPGPTLDSFDAVFDHCGICYLFGRLGMEDVIPAMCAYDYTMAEKIGTVFTRQYTIAGGGPYCDCHYQKERGNEPA